MNIQADLRSKIYDGFLPGLLLFLLFIVSLLLVSPIEYMTGKPGVMVYALALLAVSVICLERSVNLQTTEMNRALNGMASGALCWTVIETSVYIGSLEVESVTGVLIFITLSLIVTTVWRRGLPMGIQYFSGTFILLWGSYLVIAANMIIFGWVFESMGAMSGAGWFFLLLAAITAAFIMVRNLTRLERLWASVLIAFFMLLALNTFQIPDF
jgi:hypothetical protein